MELSTLMLVLDGRNYFKGGTMTYKITKTEDKQDNVLEMKDILDREIKDFKGNVIMSSKDKGLVVRDALLNIIGSSKAKNGADAIKSYRLGMKVAEINNLEELSTEEKAMLLSKVKENAMYVTLVQGCLISILE